ncbi:MAG: hypothetical protein JNK60_00275, partial [Acidobacteria bacterium]|nr:hypothetical protein [Acidobacteriota bacterium]
LALVVLVALLPETVVGAVVGFGFGRLLGSEEGSGAARTLGGMHLAIVLAFGIPGGLAHRLRFSWDTFRVYPVPARSLLLAELLTGLFELMPLLALFSFAGLGLGLYAATIGASSAIPVVLLSLQGVLWTLLITLLIGSLKRAFAKTITRNGALALAALGAAALALLWWSQDATLRQVPRLLARGFGVLRDALPSTSAYAGLDELARGNTAACLSSQGLLLLSTGALFLLALLAHAAEGALETRAKGNAPGTDERVFTFSSPSEGIARLFVRLVVRSRDGRILLYLPCAGVAVVAFLVKVLPRLVPEGAPPLPSTPPDLPVLALFVAFVLFNDTALFFSQFGVDGAGIRSLLLLPISPRDLVLGKLRGLATLVGCQLGLSLLPWLALRPIGALEAVFALSAGGTAFLGLAGAGLLFSVRFPQKPLGEGDLSRVPFALLLVPAAVTALVFGGLALIWRLARALAPAVAQGVPPFAPLAFVALFACAAALYVKALPTLSASLWANRERLAEELG